MNSTKAHSPQLRAMVVLSFVSMIAASLSENLRSPLYSALVDFFNLNHSQASLLFWMAAVSMILGSLFISTFLSGRTVISQHTYGLSLVGLGNTLAVFATTFEFLVLSFALASLGYGMLNITHNVLIEQGTTPHQRRRYVFGLHCTYAAAAALSPFAYEIFKSQYQGPPYHVAIITTCAALLPIAYAFYLLSGSDGQYKPMKENNAHVSTGHRLPLAGYLFGLSLGFYVSAEILLCTRLAVIVEKVLGYSKQASNEVLGWFLLLFVLGRLFIFLFNPNIDFKKWSKPLLLLAAVSLVAGLRVHPWFLIFTGVLISPLFPALIDLAMEQFGLSFARVLSKVMVGIGLSLGLMHYITGILSDHFGFEAVATFASTLLVLSSISFTMWRARFSSLKTF